MADSDPEDEIGDVKRPKDRPLDPGDREAVPHLIGPGTEADKNDRAKKNHKRNKPDGRVANGPQKIGVDFPFSLKIHILKVGHTGPAHVSSSVYIQDVA